MSKTTVHVEIIRLQDGSYNWYVITTTIGRGVFASSRSRGNAPTREAACDAAELPRFPALWRQGLEETIPGCWDAVFELV